MPRRPDLAVFGAGSWGPALAVAWSRHGHTVALWGRSRDKIEAMASSRRHPRLEGVELPPSLHPVWRAEEALAAPLWISCLPTQATPLVWAELLHHASAKPELLLHSSRAIRDQQTMACHGS